MKPPSPASERLPACVQRQGAALRLKVKAQPRASRTEIAGMLGAELRIRVAAPPVDGAANDALVRFLAETLDLPRSQVRLANGAASSHKTFEVHGLPASDLAGRLGLDC